MRSNLPSTDQLDVGLNVYLHYSEYIDKTEDCSSNKFALISIIGHLSSYFLGVINSGRLLQGAGGLRVRDLQVRAVDGLVLLLPLRALPRLPLAAADPGRVLRGRHRHLRQDRAHHQEMIT